MGRGVLAAHVVLTALVVGTVLLPLADLTQRIVVGGLLAVMIVLQGVLLLRFRERWRQQPRVVRWADTAIAFWGLITAINFLVTDGSAGASVVSALVGAGIFAIVMWFVVPREDDSSRAHGTVTDTGRGG
ncbi:hypothetical protein ACR9E3_04655 [Actinomycetospora sp. C-140]